MNIKKNIKKENYKFKPLNQYLNEQYPTKAKRQKADGNFNRLCLGYDIYIARKKIGFTQADLAKKLFTTQSEVARIEGGDQNITTDKLNQIAKALNKRLQISLK
ncbi:MAG: helix-turn-helix transcriptional regulator [bacterium]|nr:helix-turn-helix transcriptional regulator [bacterium]